MIFPKAKQIAKEQDWRKTKNGVFGLYKGYFFDVSDASLLSNPQSKSVIAATDALTVDQKLQIRTELDANKKLLKFSNYEIRDNGILIQFIENSSFTKLKTIYSLFDFLVDLFKKLDIADQNKCHNCGTKNNTAYCNINDQGAMLCNTCFHRLEDDFNKLEREKTLEEKNYLQGFWGSVIFSIPGIIAWVLVAVFLSRIASGMAVIIALLGVKGYEYFKGRQGRVTKYVIVISNIACILIANIATIVALLMREGLTFGQSFMELQANEAVKKIFYENTAISFTLAFFVWIWLLISLRDKKLTVKLADKI